MIDHSQVFNKRAAVYGANKFAPPGGMSGLFNRPFGVPQGQSMNGKAQQGNAEQGQLFQTMSQQNKWLQQQLTQLQKRGPGGAPGSPTGSSPDVVRDSMSSMVKRIGQRMSKLKFASADLERLLVKEAGPGEPWYMPLVRTIGGRRGDALDRFTGTGGKGGMWERGLKSVGNSRVPVAAPLARAMGSTSTATNRAMDGDWRGAGRSAGSAGAHLANYALQGTTLLKAPLGATGWKGTVSALPRAGAAAKALPMSALGASVLEGGTADARQGMADMKHPAASPTQPGFSWTKLFEFIMSLIRGKSGQPGPAMTGGGQ